MTAITAERFGVFRPRYSELAPVPKEQILTPPRTNLIGDALLNAVATPILLGMEYILDRMENFGEWRQRKEEDRQALLKSMAKNAIGSSSLLITESYQR